MKNNKLKKIKPSVILAQRIFAYKSLKDEINIMTKKADALKKVIWEAPLGKGVFILNNKTAIVKKHEQTQKRLDFEKLKTNHFEVYEDCQKDTKIKKIEITINE
mgnify:CR=1